MRKIRLLLFVLLSTAVFAIGGCDLLDPTNVDNPNVVENQALKNPDPLQRWVLGLDRQMAILLNNTIDYTSIATDNYVNTETFYNQNADNLQFLFSDSDVDGMFIAMNDLRESAQFGKNRVVPADDNPTAANQAELDFYEGMAHTFLGEHFHSAPLDSAGAQASPADHFSRAVSRFQDAIDRGAGDQVGYRLAQARAYYNNGNLSEARSRAQEVLSMDSDYVRLVEYDNQNGPANVMQDALYDRSTLDDYQPLPRLDFLDPKYGVSGAEEDPIPLLKAEEAHLILIEADLAEGNTASAKSQMKDLLDLVQNVREPRFVDERGEGRRHEGPSGTPRPNMSGIEVRASPSDPYRSGLVLDRTSLTEVPGVSGISVTETMVDTASTMQEMWELYYLMRQEIFMAEGRRFVTFNLKLPLPENEQLLNPDVDAGSNAVQPIIPSFIQGQPLDVFTWPVQDDPTKASVAVNMNRVLANNRQEVSPFL
jgi:tetratricopeptide (TPR) repeat protein